MTNTIQASPSQTAAAAQQPVSANPNQQTTDAGKLGSVAQSSETTAQPSSRVGQGPKALIAGTANRTQLEQIAQHLMATLQARTFVSSATVGGAASGAEGAPTSDIDHGDFVKFIRNLQTDLDQMKGSGCEKVDLVALVMSRTQISLIERSMTQELTPEKWNDAMQEAYQFVTVLQALLAKDDLLADGGNVVVVNEQTGEGIDFTRTAFESMLRYAAQNLGAKNCSLSAISSSSSDASGKVDAGTLALINSRAQFSRSGMTAEHLDMRAGQQIARPDLSAIKPIAGGNGRLLAVIPGIRDEGSIAYQAAKQLKAQYGDDIDFVFLHRSNQAASADGPRRAAAEFGNATLIQCDASKISDINKAMDKIAKQFGNKAIDVFVHSVAFTHKETLAGNLLNTMKSPYFQQGSQISAASFVQFIQAAQNKGVWNEDSIAFTMGYIGGEKIAQNYDGMGAHKAALQQVVAMLAADPEIRGNFIDLSSGPVPTKASSVIDGFENMAMFEEARLLLQSGLLTQEDVGRALANMVATGVAPYHNGETVMVDKGTSKVEIPTLSKLNAEALRPGHHATLMQGDHFSAHSRGDYIELTFNSPGSSNVLSGPAIRELEKAIDIVTAGQAEGTLKEAKAIIISSEKSQFCLGADIHEFRQLFAKPTDGLKEYINNVHCIFRKLETQPLPVIAEVNGFALGGGLELALASDQIVATPSAQFMLPECKNVNVMPGYGGITRLISKVNNDAAKFSTMQTILSGEPTTAVRAHQLGVIDELAPTRKAVREKSLAIAAEITPEELAASRAKKEAPIFDNIEDYAVQFELLESLGRSVPKLFRQPENIGPQEAIAAFKESSTKTLDEALEIECEHFKNCAHSEAAGVAVGRFALGGDIGKTKLTLNGVMDMYASKADPIDHVGIIGLGTMGAGIALDGASKGLQMTGVVRAGSEERSQGRVEGAVKQATKRDPSKAEGIKAAIHVETSSDEASELQGQQILIEAGPENMDYKKSIVQRLAANSSPNAVIATNTSTLSVTEMAEPLSDADKARLIGIHFFNPVPKMKLVEVVITPHTSEKTIANTMAYLKKLGKVGVIVKDQPGFVVNSTLTPLLDQGRTMIEKGVKSERVDEWVRRNGWPMGITRLADLVGNDICQEVLTTMHNAYPNRVGDVDSSIFKVLTDAGKLGQKSEQGGFCQYVKPNQPAVDGDGKAVKNSEVLDYYRADVDQVTTDTQIRMRLGLSAALEALRNLPALSEDYNYNADGVRVADPETRPLDVQRARVKIMDATLAQGLGAPAVIGFLDEVANRVERDGVAENGMQYVLDLCKTMHEDLGDTFEAPALLVELAESNGRFKG